MISHYLKTGLMSLCLIFLSSCDSRKDRINKQVNDLYLKTIHIPYSAFDTLVVDSTNLLQKPNYQLLVYLDSTECTPCYANHHDEWEYILKECRRYEASISLTIIIETKNLGKFFASNFGRTIYIDKEGAFRKRNPFFPESKIMHVLLLDEGGRVILVGNPLNNKKIEELLYSKLRNS